MTPPTGGRFRHRPLQRQCTYCFYADEMEQRPDLPTDAWLAFFDELGSLAVRSVCLSGGEVFTRPDLWALIDRAIDNRMRYSLLSNGTLVDDAIVARLLERRTRLDSVQISIDGSCAEIHDASRGRGIFERRCAGCACSSRPACRSPAG